MPPIPLKYVASFTSQDPRQRAENVLSEDASRRWLCAPDDRSGKMEAQVQLQQACVISHLDIGTWQAFSVSVCVGRSCWPPDRPFLPLLPTTTFTSPQDCRRGNNKATPADR